MIERAQAQLGTATWGDLLARRRGVSDRVFVGHRYEQEQFRLNYLYEVPQILLFVLQGAPGIGKTAMLTRYRAVAEEHRGLTAVVDRHHLTLPREFSIVQAMETLVDQLAVAGSPLTTFREVHREVMQAIRAIDADTAAPGRVFDLFGGVTDPDPWAQRAWDTYFTRTVSLRQASLVRDPVGALTERFVQDLNAWAVVRRIVLCFDDWDQTGTSQPGLETWLPALLCSGRLSTNVWFVVTSRSPLGTAWEPLAPVTRTFELQPLDPQESLALLQTPLRSAAKSGDPASGNGHLPRPSAETTAVAVDAAKGNPLSLTLLACGSGKPDEVLLHDETFHLDGYVDSLKPVHQAALLKCAAARWLDDGVLAVLLGEETARNTAPWLASSPVVERADSAWHFRPALHDRLIALARARIGPAWEASHQTLFAYYRQRVELAGVTPHPLDSQWQHDKLEAVYHELMDSDEPDSLCHALACFLDGIRHFYPWAGAVASTWQDAARVAALTAKSGVSVEVADNVHALWTALVERHWEEALDLVEELRDVQPLTAGETQAQFTSLRQLIASRLVLPPTPELAEQSSEEPETTSEEIAAATVVVQQPPVAATPPAAREMPHAEAQQHEDVIQLPAERDDAFTAPNISEPPGETREAPAALESPRESGDVPDEDRLAQAVVLCSDANGCLNRREYEAAIRRYDEALALNPAYVAACYNRGIAYSRIGALDSAVADFTWVIKLDPAQAQAYRQRGLIHARKGDYERAIQDYDAALTAGSSNAPSGTDPASGAILYERANAYSHLGAHEQALADYTAVLEQAPNHLGSHINRGLAYSALGNHPEALRDFNHAISLAPNHASSYHHRGQVYAKMGRYTEALKDYDRALEIDPRSAVIHNNRGLLYVKIEAYPEAIEAYQRAMALQPDWATPYYNAACAAALTQDVEHASIWLARAIGLREAYRAMALRDPDLASIRDHPRFRALIDAAG